MKVNSKRILAVILVLTIAFTAVVPSFASDFTWEALWTAEYDNGVILFPEATKRK